MSIKKTNAARALDKLGIAYELRTFEVDENDLSAMRAAAELHEDPQRVFKTLLARGDRQGLLMACIPAAAEVDLKRLAVASGNKQVTMVPLKDVLPLTGYMRGGCSPLAAKKAYPVFIDASAQQHERISISAGQRGVQLVLCPHDLAGAVHATFVDIICQESAGL